MYLSEALVIWMSSTAMKAPRIAPKIAIQSRLEGWRSSSRAFMMCRREAEPESRRPAAAPCGYRPWPRPKDRADPIEHRIGGRIEQDLDRHALHDLGEIAGGVFRRQQRKYLAAAGRNAVQGA